MTDPDPQDLPATRRERLTRPRLLVVDDQRFNAVLLQAMFAEWFDVFMVTDPANALRKCRELQPDVVLLDVMMPEMDGFAVCRALKDDPLCHQVPVLFVTGHLDEGYEVQGFAAGAADFLRKPLNVRVAQARVFHQLAFKRQADLLREQANTDPLTGLPNRRVFDSRLDVYSRQASRERTPLSLLIMDVDHFKAYNDLHGHPAGDRCLQRVAGAVASALQRPLDLAARYGGEEFACLLPNTSADGGLQCAQRIEQQVRGLGIVHGGLPVMPVVTISVGVATLLPDGEPATAALARADEALYRAKRQGRGQAVASLQPLLPTLGAGDPGRAPESRPIDPMPG